MAPINHLHSDMDMDRPTANPRAFSSDQIFTTLRRVFYEAVPTTYQTYCIVTAQISQRALLHFGIEAKVTPCQVWYAGPDKNYVLGFHQKTLPQQWDGHAICLGQGWLIDAALHHFRKEFALDVPNIVVKRAFGITSNVISRLDLGPDARLWWHLPPHHVSTVVPAEPVELVADLSNRLIDRIYSDLHESMTA